MAELDRLCEKLAQPRQQLLDGWIEAIARRAWQLRGRPASLAQLREHCDGLAEALHRVLMGEEVGLALGEPQWREPLHLLSFTSGWMAGSGLPISAALALCHGLRDVAGGPARLYEELIVVVAEAFTAGVMQQAAARHRQVVEKSQVVCTIAELPCLFLVADPDRQALDDAVGRLMMLAVMREAHAMVVDASGLITPEETLRQALSILADHRREPPPRLFVANVADAVKRQLAGAEQPQGVSWHEHLAQAVAAAGAER